MRTIRHPGEGRGLYAAGFPGVAPKVVYHPIQRRVWVPAFAGMTGC